ncbi:MAG: hypothetical protein OS130_10930 [Thermodesulfobacteriota bacterium]|nr:MAG: hypothetical protein OS130_10930 [Thermodesulfobacteriota bacterium]
MQSVEGTRDGLLIEGIGDRNLVILTLKSWLVVFAIKNSLKIRKGLKFGGSWSLTAAIVWVFDYIWMPWLGITFQYFAMIPLFLSLVVACYIGLYLYNFLDEDVFFIGKIKPWLDAESSWVKIERIKQVVRKSPKLTFIVLSSWWSPLHAHFFFRDNNKGDKMAVVSIVEGSIYCTLFWGVVIDLIIFIYRWVKMLFHHYTF